VTGQLDGLGYDELLAEAEPYLRAYGSGGPQGGEFALGGGRIGGKGKRHPGHGAHGQHGHGHPAHATFGWDGSHGTGYGQKNGDAHVHDLQEAVNVLGITDDHGQALKDDGKFGPRTASAVKKLQKQLGMDPTGQVTQEFIDQIVRIAAKVSHARKPRRHRAVS
jgi:hypothetical protein